MHRRTAITRMVFAPIGTASLPALTGERNLCSRRHVVLIRY